MDNFQAKKIRILFEYPKMYIYALIFTLNLKFYY